MEVQPVFDEKLRYRSEKGVPSEKVLEIYHPAQNVSKCCLSRYLNDLVNYLIVGLTTCICAPVPRHV